MNKPVVHFRGTATQEGSRMVVCAIDHPNFPPDRILYTSTVINTFEDGSFETLNTIYKPVLSTIEGLSKAARELVKSAEKHGLVLTVKTHPRQPLAMGNYDMVVEVRDSNKVYRGGA